MSQRLPPEHWTHGRNCYANHGCRCAVCRTDAALYQHERKVRKQCRETKTLPPVEDDPGHTWPELVAAALAQQEQKR